ncbi:hypothetical protein GQ457_05G030750 [Hibiscus cannabinus]
MGITLHDSKPGMAGLIRSSQAVVGKDRDNDGDVISIYSSSDVILLGHSDDSIADEVMEVTLVFNRLGKGLIEVRIGYTHVADNRYDEWNMYAIGGRANRPFSLKENSS